MRLFLALRALRRRPRSVIAVLVLACLVAVAIPYRIPSLKSRQHKVGIASASALVDTTRSQVADLGLAAGSAVTPLAYRASLLASIMTSSSLKNTIAQLAGIPANSLVATGPATVVGSDSPAPSVNNSSISPSSPKASLLSASVPTLAAGQLPVIQVNTQAPTAALAASLANAAFSALQSDVNSAAGTAGVPALQRVVIRPLGSASSTTEDQGPGLLIGILGGVFVFLLGCSAILGISATAARWRTESAAERRRAEPDDPFLERPQVLESPQAVEEPELTASPDEVEGSEAIESPPAVDDDELDVVPEAQELAKARSNTSPPLELAYSRLTHLLEADRPPETG